MKQAAPHKKGHVRLKIMLGVIALLVAGYFIYKYTYIYVERQKFNQAAAAINKVADDLRSQGINTEFSRGCGRNQVLYGRGGIICSVNIIFKENEKNRRIVDIVPSFEKYLKLQGFKYESKYGISYKLSPSPTGSSVYSLKNNDLQCQMALDNNAPDGTAYSVELLCSGNSRFSLF